MKLINIGCGQTLHPDWINLDLVPSSSAVRSFDIRRGLPFADRTCDVCYSSHVLEHLQPAQASFLIAEAFRVLKPGGILRVIVPDLEQIARLYLATLEQSLSGDSQAIAQYDWMLLELLDQMTRTHGGGEMGQYLDRLNAPNADLTLDFVRSRMGAEIDNYYQAKQLTRWQKIKSKRPAWYLQKIRIKIAELFVLLIAGKQAQKGFQEGLFRNSGELHRWMYDRFSLQQLLSQTGFIEIQVCQATESRIPNFNDFGLDILQGQIRKPDSLFMEAVKP
ncbi:methyltransferase domain-containing protein [Alkalinema sp. FACHB-956]|uniref:class I SAM-dependent methyltransferase n=1 Tax=Alkalinema sp. FACHB-956 TaxID=2692768 RepID=UPI001682AED3|nr:methyltransferase domain-containing protein [Alkalinema sp. FACHB-956]MBD2327189.1 methyltransferase domain-containing protein [Alkalinema sp. FACHB-956]